LAESSYRRAVVAREAGDERNESCAAQRARHGQTRGGENETGRAETEVERQ
jgi:hypothetical protein